MMRLFRRYILGGKTDTTEGTLFAFLIGVAWMTAIIVLEAMGFDMGNVIEPVGWYLAATVSAFTGAKVARFMKAPQGAQEPGQGAQDGFPGDPLPPEQDAPPDGPHSGREIYPR